MSEQKNKQSKATDVRNHPARNLPPATQDYWGEYSSHISPLARQFPVGDMDSSKSSPVKKSDSPKYDTDYPTNPGDLNTEPYTGPVQLYRGAPFEHDN